MRAKWGRCERHGRCSRDGAVQANAQRPADGLAVAAVSIALAAVAALTVVGAIELTTPRSRAATRTAAAQSETTAATPLGAPPGPERILEGALFAREAPERPEAHTAARVDGCDTRLRLVGTVEARSSSVAAIRAPGASVQIVRIGAAIGDGARVTAIEAATVTLTRADGVVCSLALFSDLPAADGRDTGIGQPLPAQDDGLVRQVGHDEYEISRELIDRTLRTAGDLRGGRFVLPYEEGGRVVGLKVFGVRPDRILGRLGLRNGDLLRAINGYQVADPYDALEAYARLRGARELSLSLERDGQTRTLRYHVR